MEDKNYFAGVKRRYTLFKNFPTPPRMREKYKVYNRPIPSYKEIFTSKMFFFYILLFLFIGYYQVKYVYYFQGDLAIFPIIGITIVGVGIFVILRRIGLQ